MSITDFTIQLHDGRAIGVASVGKSDGFPIIHCHGSGSSRLEVDLLATEAVAEGIWLIGLDRPGVGRSDARPGYRLLDWADDVAEVADRLEIERFALNGVSAGGPYALACASKIPHRITACGLVSTISPPDLIRKAGPGQMRVLWWIGEHWPRLLRFYARQVQHLSGTDVAGIERYFTRYASRLGAADQQVLSNPEMRRLLVIAFAESFRQGGAGNLEVLTEAQSWGFPIEEIGCQNIFLWHGEEDHIMPVAPVRLFAQILPHCTATFYPTEGHFSLPINYARAILHSLRTPVPVPKVPD